MDYDGRISGKELGGEEVGENLVSIKEKNNYNSKTMSAKPTLIGWKLCLFYSIIQLKCLSQKKKKQTN